MSVIYTRPLSLKKARSHYCPGCGHGTVQKILAEIVDEFEIREKTIGVAPVGCSVTLYNYWDFDVCEASHGRAAAVATGIKRVHPDKVVLCYQGDGDLASIGLGETMHAANRGENFTVIFINNTNYGMTGGQMAPTTLPGQKTTTSPLGRAPSTEGYPMKMAELIAGLEAVKFSVRTHVADANGVMKTKAALKKAITAQMQGQGYCFIEVLSNCSTNWGLDPREANNYLLDTVAKTFAPGVIKDILPKMSGGES